MVIPNPWQYFLYAEAAGITPMTSSSIIAHLHPRVMTAVIRTTVSSALEPQKTDKRRREDGSYGLQCGYMIYGWPLKSVWNRWF